MKSNHFKFHPFSMRRAGLRLMQAAALALVVSFAIPARAAEERAVRFRVAPAYPEIAKRMRISGVVHLEVTIDPDGKVTGIKQISGNNMLSIAAEDAVRKWRFASAPASSTEEVALSFTL
jgi:TonB family protein